MSTQVETDIQEILDNFDFVKVYKTMIALNWTWYNKGIPGHLDLVSCAKSLLVEAANKLQYNLALREKDKGNCSLGTGGFNVKARKYKNDTKIYFELTFVVAEWSSY